MPTIYTSLNDLLVSITSRITSNGNNEITGAVHREVLQDITMSLHHMMEAVSEAIVAAYPPWVDSETYQPGSQTIVRHDGRLWLFVGATANAGTEPGTNGTVWAPLSALDMAHPKDRDLYLDRFGPHQVGAHELHGLLANYPPTLNAVLNAGNTAPGNMQIGGLAFGEAVYEDAAGDIVLDGAKTLHRVMLSGDVVLKRTDAMVGGTFIIRVVQDYFGNHDVQLGTDSFERRWFMRDGQKLRINKEPGGETILRGFALSADKVMLDVVSPAVDQYTSGVAYDASGDGEQHLLLYFLQHDLVIRAESIELSPLYGVDGELYTLNMHNTGAGSCVLGYSEGAWMLPGSGYPVAIASGERLVMQCRYMGGKMYLLSSDSFVES